MTGRDWYRVALNAERERDDARAQLAYEQAQRRQWETTYMAGIREVLDDLEDDRDRHRASVERVRELVAQDGAGRYYVHEWRAHAIPINDIRRALTD